MEQILCCADCREVRWVIYVALALGVCPVLEKVQAHDTDAITSGSPKAVGNDLDDSAARAATSAACPLLAVDLAPFGDPLELLDSSGAVVSDVSVRLAVAWWDRRRTS